MIAQTAPSRPEDVRGFWSAELRRLMDERIAETGNWICRDPDAWTWHVAEQASREALDQLAADFRWIHERQPRWRARETVRRIEVDVAARHARQLARHRLSLRMAVRLMDADLGSTG